VSVLVFGDTVRSPALRHEVPLAIGDPLLYLEAGARRAVVTNALEVDRIARAAPDLERLLMDALGLDELLAEGLARAEAYRRVFARAVAELGIRSAVVPPDFPLALADLLRADGVELTADDALFDERRRRKTDAEMAGIRRATEAGLAGLAEAGRLLREARIDGERLVAGGEALTAEHVRTRGRRLPDPAHEGPGRDAAPGVLRRSRPRGRPRGARGARPRARGPRCADRGRRHRRRAERDRPGARQVPRRGPSRRDLRRSGEPDR
jgi:hypothetical protein